MGLSSSGCLQSCEGCVTASQADFNSATLWKWVAYPGCAVRVGRRMWCCETWRGNTRRLLRDNSSKQSCGGSVRITTRWVLGWNDPQNCTQALPQRELDDQLPEKPRERTDLQTRNWGLSVGWGDKLFGFLRVPYIHSDRVKTELSCKNIKHQI